MNEVVVSVLCLIYNHEKYLRQMLDSLVCQKTDFKYEIVLHDDASTDDSVKIMNEYKQKYPELINIILEKNNKYQQGINIVTEYLLPNAKGQYLAFCEGDDFWTDPTKLQRQYEMMIQNPDCCICTHAVGSCEENGKKNDTRFPSFTNNRLKSDVVLPKEVFMKMLWLEDGYPFHTSSFFVKREIFEKDYSAKGVWNTRDTYQLLACAHYGGCVYINKEMSTYRNHSNGSWTMKVNQNGKEGWYNLYKDDFEKCLFFDQFTNQIYHEMIITKLFGRTLKWAFYNPLECKQRLLEHDITYCKVKNNLSKSNRIKGFIGYFVLVRMNWVLRFFCWIKKS